MIEGTGSGQRRRYKTRSCNARVCRRVRKRRKTGKCPLKNERANWHPTVVPYALSMCPTTITASSEEREDVTTACLVVHADVA